MVLESGMFTQEQHKILDFYNNALGLYKEKKWAEAMAGFKQALQIDPNDGPSKLYVERCEQYIKNPPGEDWDGVFVMTTK